MTEPREAKRLVFDIEWAPNTVTTWGLFNQNVAINQILKPGYMLCWSARWYGEKRIYWADVRDPDMLPKLRDLLHEADIVIGYNSKSYDVPKARTSFLLAGLEQPAPFSEVDLYRVVKRKFSFPSNKLAYVARALGLTEKLETGGHELWLRCMEGDAKAWRTMKRYNVGDITTTTDLYTRLLPLIDNHPPVLLFSAEACNRCGSTDFTAHEKPYVTTAGSHYRQLRCVGCGGWSRTVKRESGTTTRGTG